ncbi:phage tail assembly protein [Mycobacterium sp. Y57]|nr:phage tail assembly protein [Mycolicibacterium xanthum]
MRTEFPFLLPRGYVDASGTVHRRGVMRLATARDELTSQRDDRVRESPNYLAVVLISRVVTELGGIEDVHAGIIENLFASDLAFLQDLYRRVNQDGHTHARVTCPECDNEFAVDVAGSRLGES